MVYFHFLIRQQSENEFTWQVSALNAHPADEQIFLCIVCQVLQLAEGLLNATQNPLFHLKRQKYNKFVSGCQFDSLAFAPTTGSHDYKMCY